MRRSATGLLVLGAWIQIGSCVFATIVGAAFVVGSLIDPGSARAAQPLAFVSTSLPAFLVLSALLLSLVVKLRVEHQEKVFISRYQNIERSTRRDLKSSKDQNGGCG